MAYKVVTGSLQCSLLPKILTQTVQYAFMMQQPSACDVCVDTKDPFLQPFKVLSIVSLDKTLSLQHKLLLHHSRMIKKAYDYCFNI